MVSYINRLHATERWKHKRRGKKNMSIISTIKSPLAILVLFIVAVVFAGLTVAASISGALTAAAVSAAGFFVIILILAALNTIGKGGG